MLRRWIGLLYSLLAKQLLLLLFKVLKLQILFSLLKGFDLSELLVDLIEVLLELFDVQVKNILWGVLARIIRSLLPRHSQTFSWFEKFLEYLIRRLDDLIFLFLKLLLV